MENTINNYISENRIIEAMEECKKNNFSNILKLLILLYKDEHKDDTDFKKFL